MNALLSEIIEMDKILAQSYQNKYQNEIDMSNKNWRALAIQEGKDFYEEHRDAIEPLSERIVDAFQKCDAAQRQEIFVALKRTKQLSSYLSTNQHEKYSKEWFNERIFLFILHDLGYDTRDALMEIHALNVKSKKHNVDLVEIIKANRRLADDVNWHGMGSTKRILDNWIANIKS